MISAGAERAFKRVVVGSAARGEGRTTVAVNLACTLARSRKKVLLVDADLQRPSIMRRLGIDGDVGLGEIFRWQNPGSALLAVSRFGFDLLPTRSRVANSAEVLASRPFSVAIELLEPHYDFILFDAPPLLDSADAHLLMRIADTMLMVIGAGKLKTSQLAKAVEGLKPEDIFGVALNRVRAASSWLPTLVAGG
jgi:capsular exopolysaccharide synthesis family protein